MVFPENITEEDMNRLTRNESLIEANLRVLQDLNLLNQGMLHFINRASAIAVKPFNAAQTECELHEMESLDRMLGRLLSDYGGNKQGSQIYDYLLKEHGPAALTFEAWWAFGWYSDWKLVKRTFKDMPTNILELYLDGRWDDRFFHEEDGREICQIISQRDDDYGQLPPEVIKGIFSNKP